MTLSHWIHSNFAICDLHSRNPAPCFVVGTSIRQWTVESEKGDEHFEGSTGEERTLPWRESPRCFEYQTKIIRYL